MVRPIDLQDNFSKTLIPQRMVDEAVAGAEKQQAIRDQVTLNQLQEQERKKAPSMDGRKGAKGIDARSGGGKRTLLKKGPKKPKKDGEEDDGEENLQDLRLRKDEDDSGKGGTLDIVG